MHSNRASGSFRIVSRREIALNLLLAIGALLKVSAKLGQDHCLKKRTLFEARFRAMTQGRIIFDKALITWQAVSDVEPGNSFVIESMAGWF